MTNKTQEVLKHLQKNGSITTWTAIELYAATRLSAIIYCLREKGYNIVDVWEEGIDKYGRNIRYVKYVYFGNNIKGKIDEWIEKIKAKKGK